jgi:hypothetical protein
MARQSEKSIPLHGKHPEQVSVAVRFFEKKAEEEKQRERQVDAMQGPNERKALSYLDAILSLQLANAEEKELLLNAKMAVRLGKFQQLQREINKFTKVVKATPLKPAVLLEELLKIIRKYPLLGIYESNIQSVSYTLQVKEIQPEIIISESFDK